MRKNQNQTHETKEKELPKEALTPREELINDITKAGYTVIEAIEQIEEMEGKKTPQEEESLSEGLQKNARKPNDDRARKRRRRKK